MAKSGTGQPDTYNAPKTIWPIAGSLNPRPDFLDEDPRRRSAFLTYLLRVRASAVLQCSGDPGYQRETRRNRERLAGPMNLDQRAFWANERADHAAA